MNILFVDALMNSFTPEHNSELFGCAHFAAELRDNLLNGEIFYSLKEAQVVIEQWRRHYNAVRPRSSLNYRPPAPQMAVSLAFHLDEITPMQ